MKDLLLEIGCENIPASYVPPAVEQLKQDAAGRLEESRLSFEDVYTSGTPRRLILLVKQLAAAQKSKIDTVLGPPVSKSFDESGAPTRAAVGFAKSQGLTIENLQKIETEKGLYLGFRKRQKGRKTGPILRQLLPELIAGLKFPKTMRWEGSGARFARPIRWIACLYGERIVRFEFAGVASGNVTFYLPWIKPAKIRIQRADRYFEVMGKAGIVVDKDKRRRRIETLARRAAKRLGFELVEDPGLFEELTFMLEDPNVFVGNFPDRYLSLPPEIVVTAMKAHQRYLAVRDKQGSLLPKFVAFSEGKLRGSAGIRKGNERVLKARLEDAFFYWQEDLKRGIEGLSSMLGSIVFVEKLGTLEDKAARLENLLRFLNDALPPATQVDAEKIKRISLFAKADLASEMVKDGKEFTLLEGLIGSFYASAGGEDGEVVDAIREQYRPRFPADPLPDSSLGALLGIADRMDTVCGCFLAGLLPTGSGDPYGLRRLSNGMLRILEERPIVRIDRLLEAAVSAYRNQGFADPPADSDTVDRLRNFFSARCEAFLSEKGFSYDVVRAAASVAWMEPGSAVKRCRGIEGMRGNAAFERLIIGVKRVGNILGEEEKIYGVDWDTLKEALFSSRPLSEKIRFRTELFREEMEDGLLGAVRERFPLVADLDREGNFPAVLETLSGLGPSIDAYFDAVLVNCEDRAVRSNRLHFLACIFALFSKFADFSYIVEEGSLNTR